VRLWPVLVGEPHERDGILASPIILYDYPQIASESAGDFFDGTEIDEMLALRVLTLTDAEKDEARRTDPRARALVDRTEALSGEQLLKLHGILRDMRPVIDGASR
jgi:hydrogenase maturation protease